MSANNEPPTSQSFTPFWMAAPGSPATAVVGNPVANPVPTAELNMGSGGVSNSVPPTMSQDITTMANAVPHDDFTNSLTEPTQPSQQPQTAPAPPPPQPQPVPPVPTPTQPQVTQVSVAVQQPAQQQSNQPAVISATDQTMTDQTQQTVQTVHTDVVKQSAQHTSTTSTDVVVVENAPACSSTGSTKFFTSEEEIADAFVLNAVPKKEKKIKAQRRRLSPSHREMIIDLVFNEKKTSREVRSQLSFYIE